MPSEKSLFNPLKKPFVITGRTGRAGYWRFFFFYVYVVVVLVLVLTPVAADVAATAAIFVLTFLLVLTAIRRLRDAGMSCSLLLLALLPLVGTLALLALLARPGISGTGTPQTGIGGIVRGKVEGILEGFRFFGAVLDFSVIFLEWLGNSMGGPSSHYCRWCRRRIYPPGSLYCDRCLLDSRWGEGCPRRGPSWKLGGLSIGNHGREYFWPESSAGRFSAWGMEGGDSN